MSGWRTLVIDSCAKLDLSQKRMVVRRGNKVDKVLIEEIQTLIIESTAVSLTAALLAELSKAKVKIIFCDEKHLPSAELMPYYGAHDSTRKIRAQAKWASETKRNIWTTIVREKIRKQQQLLERLGKEKHHLLNEYQRTVEEADATNREGQAAKVYFSALFGLDFTRGSDCTINAALNYGYSILLAAFSREIVASGYITQLGLSHDSVFNHFNLASDLMEPFRPLIDEMVYGMELEIFGKEEKHQLVDVMNRQVILKNRKERVSNAIRLYCQSVFNAIDKNDPTLIRFYENEL